MQALGELFLSFCGLFMSLIIVIRLRVIKKGPIGLWEGWHSLKDGLHWVV